MNALWGVPLWTRNAWNALHRWNVVRVGKAPNQIVVKVPGPSFNKKTSRSSLCALRVHVDPQVVNDVEALEFRHV